jgi:hypothetical protein
MRPHSLSGRRSKDSTPRAYHYHIRIEEDTMEKQKVHYSELGLANTKEMFAKAMAGKYAIPAYNFNNLEQIQAIITACAETNSPVIIQVS